MSAGKQDLEFPGFPVGLLPFLDELASNNQRPWFLEHKQRYENLVSNPALDFIAAMAGPLADISKHFEAIPRRSGGSLMRIYRDTRFGRDKTPYKTNLGIQFRHVRARDIHAPGFYLHIEPAEVFVGVGCWRPDRQALARIRQRIAAKPEYWQAMERDKTFAGEFSFSGDSLKRAPRGFDPEHPLIETLKRKDFIALKHFPARDIESPAFFESVSESFRKGLPLMRFLCDALELKM